jgi:hypothetical protein
MNLRSWLTVRKESSGNEMWQPQQARCSASSSITYDHTHTNSAFRTGRPAHFT